MTENKHSHPRNIGSNVEQSKQDAKRQTLLRAVPYLLPWLCGSRMCAPIGFLPLQPCCLHPSWPCPVQYVSLIAYGFPRQMSCVSGKFNSRVSTIFQYHPNGDFSCPFSSFQLEYQTSHTLAPQAFLCVWLVGAPHHPCTLHPCKTSVRWTTPRSSTTTQLYVVL